MRHTTFLHPPQHEKLLQPVASIDTGLADAALGNERSWQWVDLLRCLPGNGLI